MGEPTMRIAEACATFPWLNRNTVHRWIQDGRLKALAVGGNTRPAAYPLDPDEVAAMAAELDTLAAAHRRKPPGT